MIPWRARQLRPRLPEDLCWAVARHAAALTIQRAFRERVLQRYTRNPHWPELERALVGLGGPELIRTLKAHYLVRHEWAHDPTAWLCTARAPEGAETLRIIVSECAEGLWGLRTRPA